MFPNSKMSVNVSVTFKNIVIYADEKGIQMAVSITRIQ